MRLSTAQRILLPASLLFFILGVLLRYAAIHNQLWLDEIFTLKLISPLTDPWQILSLHEDNNHFLNSLWIYFAGADQRPAHLRAPACIAGILTLMLCMRLCSRQGLWQGFFGAIVFSFSYVLVLYGTEARGYSLMLLCSALSFYCFELYRRERKSAALLGFWVSAVAGAFSHLVFLHVYVALLFLSAVLLHRHEFRSVKELAKLHVVPLLAAGWLVIFHLSSMRVAGGPQGSRLEVLINALAVPFGAPELSPSSPENGVLTLIVAFFVFGILLREGVELFRRRDPLAWFFAFLVFGVPVVLVLILEPQVFVLRYILPSIFFGYFLFVRFLANLFERSVQGKALGLCLVILFITGNQRHLVQLLSEGRGNYTEALQFIAEHTQAEHVIIGGDQDFRNGLLVSYYASLAGLSSRLEYASEQFPTPTKASWVILETQDQFAVPENRIPAADLAYVRSFESASLSGARWFIYCRTPACPSILHLQ